MTDIQFVETDAKKIEAEMITLYETAAGTTLYPGDERMIHLKGLVPIVVALKNNINDSAKQNLLRNARGSVLDAIGQTYYRTTRLGEQYAVGTAKFILVAVQEQDVTIPEGIRITPDGKYYFATVSDLIITAGNMDGTVTIQAMETGVEHNGFVAGQIKTVVDRDQIPFVLSVENIDETSGGSASEEDEDYIERCQLAPESFSVAGPEGAYIYFARSADSTIADVSVSSPSACSVEVVVLQDDGDIPNQAILDRVDETLSAKDKRPLTDNVTVIAPTAVQYDIEFTYYISTERKTEEAAIRSAVEDSGGAVDKYKTWQHSKLKRAINPDKLRELLLLAGAFRIDLASPAHTDILSNQVAKANTVTVTYGGVI